MKPFTDAELEQFGDMNLAAYHATLSAREQKIFRLCYTLGGKDAYKAGYDKGYLDGTADERAQGRIDAIREGIAGFQNFMRGQQGHNPTAAAPPDFITTMGFTKEDVEAVYKRKAKQLHPDVGGSHEEMTALNKAREAALQELEHGPKVKSTRRRK